MSGKTIVGAELSRLRHSTGIACFSSRGLRRCHPTKLFPRHRPTLRIVPLRFLVAAAFSVQKATRQDSRASNRCQALRGEFPRMVHHTELVWNLSIGHPIQNTPNKRKANPLLIYRVPNS